jgi:hypothetical protein
MILRRTILVQSMNLPVDTAVRLYEAVDVPISCIKS